MAGTLQDQVTTALNVLGRLRPLAIVLVGTGLVGTMFAGVAVRDAVTAFSKAQAVSADQASQVKLARQDLTDEDYTRIGGVIAGLSRHHRRGPRGRRDASRLDREHRPLRCLDPRPDVPSAQCQKCGLGSQVHLPAGLL